MSKEIISPWAKPPVAAELGKRLRLVRRRMNDAISRQQYSSLFLSHLHQALRLPGKFLASRSATGQPIEAKDRGLWPLAVILAHAATSATSKLNVPIALWRSIAPIGAAAEFLGLALDLIDDIQDGDGVLCQKLGLPITLNIALALLGLTFDAIDDPQTPKLLHDPLHSMFTSAMLAATGGQFLDLAYEQRMHISTNDSIMMTTQKSGSLISLLFQAGAFVGSYAKADLEYAQVIGDQFAQFGRLLGTIAQLENDLHDSLISSTNQKSDRARHKKTLPLVFEAELAKTGDFSTSEIDKGVLRYISYTADMYRIQALELLEHVEASYNIHTSSLRWLVTEREAFL